MISTTHFPRARDGTVIVHKVLAGVSPTIPTMSRRNHALGEADSGSGRNIKRVLGSAPLCFTIGGLLVHLRS